jgi:hypothetical protein
MVSTKSKNHENRLDIAKELWSLVPGLELNQSPKGYYSLAIGSGPNKNVAIIGKSAQHVSFYLQDESLITTLRDAHFHVEPFLDPFNRPFNSQKYKVTPMTLSDISNHKSLFAEILRHSIMVIEKRKTKKS